MKKDIKRPTRMKLVSRRQQIEAELDRLKATLRDRAGAGPEDEADRASEDLDFDLKTAVLEEMQKEVHQIKEAMEKMSLGTYGLCEACGEPIGQSRLKALPSASLCLKCKREQERADRPAAARVGRFAASDLSDETNLVPSFEEKARRESFDVSDFTPGEGLALPVYEYRASGTGCPHCEYGFETGHRMSDPPLTQCPQCGNPVERVIQAVSVLHKTSSLLSTGNLKTHGFKKLVKSADGGYREE